MSFNDILMIIVTAASYYFFSHEFLEFVSEIKSTKVSLFMNFLSFAVIYVWFMVASYMELPLTVNWLVFLALLGIEVRYVFLFDFLTSCTLSMFCTIIGLAINLVFRSLMAIVMKLPLNVFDNMVASIKIVPIFFGFMFMGLLFYLLRYFKYSIQLKLMLQNRKSLIFLSWIEGCIYLFLVVQLLGYSQSDNIIALKMWGIKAAIFSIIVLLITNIYGLRVASLNHFMDKQHAIHNQLIQEKKDINKLWELAYTDMLTGCNNRQLLDKRLAEYATYGGSITLSFIDLNGLKIVNDQYGHLEGDKYLIAVANILMDVFDGYNTDLFRYGGDEFVLMSNTLNEEETKQLLIKANQFIQQHESVYMKSVSYGVVQGNSSIYQELLRAADDRMYQHKMKHYKSTARV